MNHQSVHMRDQKAKQMALLSKANKQSLINMLEEITVVVVMWGVYILTTLTNTACNG